MRSRSAASSAPTSVPASAAALCRARSIASAASPSAPSRPSSCFRRSPAQKDELYREHFNYGLSVLYAVLPATSTAIFEGLKLAILNAPGISLDVNSRAAEAALGAFGGAIGALVTTPPDVITTRIITQAESGADDALGGIGFAASAAVALQSAARREQRSVYTRNVEKWQNKRSELEFRQAKQAIDEFKNCTFHPEINRSLPQDAADEKLKRVEQAAWQ